MRALLILLLLFIIGVSGYLVFGKDTSPVQNSVRKEIALGDANAPDGSDEKFNYLVVQTSNNCGLQRQVVFNYSDNQRIQGSCCNKMDSHAYQEQIEGLKKYKDISIIPSDPYDIFAAQAKQLFRYLEEIELNSDQQTIYNTAMKMSDEGGPCCCKCWHWDAYEGLAKKLIVDYGWDSEQIAQLWDLSDACGGANHEHG
ncbi:hypothetical protein HYT32_00825 [Candidatus Roizmanbacteria bacterium]|nr:hypothetical protein [Candidatus Roizmanbacteria bacterium]